MRPAAPQASAPRPTSATRGRFALSRPPRRAMLPPPARPWHNWGEPGFLERAPGFPHESPIRRHTAAAAASLRPRHGPEVPLGHLQSRQPLPGVHPALHSQLPTASSAAIAPPPRLRAIAPAPAELAHFEPGAHSVFLPNFWAGLLPAEPGFWPSSRPALPSGLCCRFPDARPRHTHHCQSGQLQRGRWPG